MKEFIRKTWNEINYEIIFFAIMLFRFFTLLPIRINWWVSTYYACDYSHGFIQRGFIGQVFKYITNNDISKDNAYIFIYIQTCLLMALVAFAFGALVRNVKKEHNKKILSTLLIVYIFMPFSLSYLFGYTNFGRFDLYLYIITILQVFMLYKNPKFYKLIIATALSLLCIIIHEAYMCFVFPIFVMVLLYILHKNRFKKDLLVGAIILVTSVVFFTGYMKFFFKPNLPEAQTYINELDTATDLTICKSCVLFEYYLTSFEWHKEYFVFEHLPENLIGLVFTMILLWPINTFLIKTFKKYWGQHKKTSFWWVLICMLLGMLAYLPLFVTTSDWGRWLAGLYNYIIVLLFFVIGDKKEEFLEDIYNRVEKESIIKISIMISVLILISGFGVFQLSGIYNIVYVTMVWIQGC